MFPQSTQGNKAVVYTGHTALTLCNLFSYSTYRYIGPMIISLHALCTVESTSYSTARLTFDATLGGGGGGGGGGLLSSPERTKSDATTNLD